MTTQILTIGSDPEMLLWDTQANKVVSAIPVLKRGKDNPIDLEEGYKFYYDNTLMEANIPPASSKEEFAGHFAELFKRMKASLNNRYIPKMIASANYSKQECLHDDARVAGCQPEFDSYEMDVCSPPQFVRGFRSAGGHIHIGRKDYEEYLQNPENIPLIDPYNKADVVKLMDVFVGATLILIDKDPASPARKALYGKAGRHRPTEYGVEYRVPGNYWLRTPKLTELIYDLTAHVCQLNFDNKTADVLGLVKEQELREAIDNNKSILAKNVLNCVDSYMPKDLAQRIASFSSEVNDDLYKQWGI